MLLRVCMEQGALIPFRKIQEGRVHLSMDVAEEMMFVEFTLGVFC